MQLMRELIHLRLKLALSLSPPLPLRNNLLLPHPRSFFSQPCSLQRTPQRRELCRLGVPGSTSKLLPRVARFSSSASIAYLPTVPTDVAHPPPIFIPSLPFPVSSHAFPDHRPGTKRRKLDFRHTAVALVSRALSARRVRVFAFWHIRVLRMRGGR